MSRDVDAAVDGDMVYFRPDGTQNLLAYNSANGTWCQYPSSPSEYCSIAIINGMLTVVGGDRCWLPTAQLFSLIEESDGWRWVERLPSMQAVDRHPRTVCCGKHLIVVGNQDVIQIMDITSHKWSSVANQPHQSRRYRNIDIDSLMMCGEYLYLVYQDTTVFRCSTSDLIQSTKSKETVYWSELELTDILFHSTYVVIHGHLISVGGLDLKCKLTTAVRMYSPTTKTWEVIGHMKTPRCKCFAAVLPNNRLLVAGGCTAVKALLSNDSIVLEDILETDSVEIATIVCNH